MNNLLERFNEKITPEPNSGCWLWLGAVSSSGYSCLRINGHAHLGHRVSYKLFKGKIPSGMTIDHLCRVILCVNPDHLEAVTHAENVRRGESGKHLSSKTHCPQGHPYSGDNLYLYPTKGYRACKICRRAEAERRKQRKMEFKLL